MELKKLALITFSMCAAVTSARAETCPDSGYVLKLVEPAKTEDGFIRLTQYGFGGGEQRIHHAQYEIMTEEDYNLSLIHI